MFCFTLIVLLDIPATESEKIKTRIYMNSIDTISAVLDFFMKYLKNWRLIQNCDRY